MTDALDARVCGAGAVKWLDVQPQCSADGVIHVMASSAVLSAEYLRAGIHSWCIGVPAAITRVSTALVEDDKVFISAHLASIDALHVFQVPWNLYRTNSKKVLDGLVRVHALYAATPTSEQPPAASLSRHLVRTMLALGDHAHGLVDGDDDENAGDGDGWMLSVAIAKSMPRDTVFAPVRHDCAGMLTTHHKVDANGFPVSYMAMHSGVGGNWFPSSDDVMNILTALAHYGMINSGLRSFVHLLEERVDAWKAMKTLSAKNQLLLENGQPTEPLMTADFERLMHEAEDVGVRENVNFRVRNSACYAVQLGAPNIMDACPVSMSARFVTMMTPGEYLFELSNGSDGSLHTQHVSVPSIASPATVDLAPFFSTAIEAGDPVTAMFTGMEPTNGISLYRRAVCRISSVDNDNAGHVRIRLDGTSVHTAHISPHPLIGDRYGKL